MPDPRDELAYADMANEPGLLPPREPLRIRVSPYDTPPPSETGWGGFGAGGRPTGRLFEPDQSLAPDPEPAPIPRPSMVDALRTQNPLADTRPGLPSLGESLQALPGKLGGLVQGASDYFSRPAFPPQPRPQVDPTAGPRGMWQGGYPSPQQPTLLQRGVTESLNIPWRAVEESKGQFDPTSDYREEDARRQRQVEGVTDVTSNLAGFGMTGASLRGGASAGVFGGRLAHGADLQKQKLAELMEGNGVTPQQIWKETGWMRGADKQWMHEIPDIGASYKGNVDAIAAKIFDRQNPKRAGQYGSDTNVLRSQIARQDALLKMQGKQQLYLKDVIDHPELFQRYPELRDMPVTYDAFMQAQGGYMTAIPGEGGKILYRETGSTKNMARGETLDTLLHEIQHAIQQIEGFARGTNPSARMAKQPGTGAYEIFQKQMAQAPANMSAAERAAFEKQAASFAGLTAYRRSYGEWIANLAAQRKNMTPEQLAAIHPTSQLPKGKSYVEFNQYQPVPPRLEPKQLPLFNQPSYKPLPPYPGELQMGDVLNPAPREMQAARPQPREFWRGENVGDPRRISTGNEAWDRNFFLSSDKDSASMYGKNLTRFEAAPDAKILYEGSPEWRRIAGQPRKNESLLDYSVRAAEAARAAGYDAAHFTRQGDVGTVVFNRDKFAQQIAEREMQMSAGPVLRGKASEQMSSILRPEPLKGKPGGPWEGGIRAYHSSPHDFDKFDWSKLRTGEGANTYGAGFYFAENPAVSGQGGQYWKQFANRFDRPEKSAADFLATAGFDRNAAINDVRIQMADPRMHHSPDSLKRSQAILDLLESGAPVGPRTYEVNINARPELMLDWDKPLSAQPHIEDFLHDRLLDRYSRKRVADELSVMQNQTGESIYNQMMRSYRDQNIGSQNPQVWASEQLRDAGIPGIRYLDQGSRVQATPEAIANLQASIAKKEAAHQANPWLIDTEKNAWGARNLSALDEERKQLNQMLNPTYNYVVTDPSKLDILAKYGIVGGTAGGIGSVVDPGRYQPGGS